MTAIETLVDGLGDPVALAWHDDALWIADRSERRVVRLTPSIEELVTVTTLVGDHPGGLAWTSRGLAVTTAGSRSVVEWTLEGGLRERVSLAGVASGALAGLVEAGPDGPCYVVDEGAALHGAMPSRDAGRLLLVGPDGETRVVADELEAPAGLVLGVGGDTVLVAERAAGRITTFRIGAGGDLTDRRTVCTLAPGPRAYASGPTALALGSDGTMWCGDSIGARVVAIAADGSVIGEIALDGEPTACCWAGDDDGLLLVATRPIGLVPSARRNGRVLAIEVGELGLSRRPVAASAPPG